METLRIRRWATSSLTSMTSFNDKPPVAFERRCGLGCGLGGGGLNEDVNFLGGFSCGGDS